MPDYSLSGYDMTRHSPWICARLASDGRSVKVGMVNRVTLQAPSRSDEGIRRVGPSPGCRKQRVDFYRRSGKWTNRMVLGDSLLAVASLAEKEGR